MIGKLVPEKVTCKISSTSNIISLARIKCRKYEIDMYFTSRKTQLNIQFDIQWTVFLDILYS